MMKGYFTWRVIALLVALLGATVVVPEAVPVIRNLLEGRPPCEGLVVQADGQVVRRPCALSFSRPERAARLCRLVSSRLPHLASVNTN